MEKAAFSRGIEGVGDVWIETCWNKDRKEGNQSVV